MARPGHNVEMQIFSAHAVLLHVSRDPTVDILRTVMVQYEEIPMAGQNVALAEEVFAIAPLRTMCSTGLFCDNRAGFPLSSRTRVFASSEHLPLGIIAVQTS